MRCCNGACAATRPLSLGNDFTHGSGVVGVSERHPVLFANAEG